MENLKEFLEGNQITFIRLEIDGVTIGTEKSGSKKVIFEKPERLFESLIEYQKTGNFNLYQKEEKPEKKKESGKGLFSKESEIEKPE